MCVIKEKLWCRSGFREDFPGCMTLVRTKLDSFCPSGDSSLVVVRSRATIKKKFGKGVLIGKFGQRGCDNPNEWNSSWTQTRIKVIKETKTSVVKMEQKQS
ncbi:hypothetical protein RUM44_009145 [Polyplax serrata]|uniref:Uncharacterized protein n=1 Tax=Polyplax serrata TaxID=468196 RepID=A0ABR1ARW0_POLSC